MKFGEIYTYKNAEEAKKYIGKEGVFGDYLWEISEYPELEVSGRLIEAVGTGLFPFIRQYEDSEGENRRTKFQFFRPILEEDERMTNRQLSEWLAKGNGEMTLENNDSYIYTEKVHFKGDADKPVRDDVIIRRWRDTEWSKPTKAIYEEDCKCLS